MTLEETVGNLCRAIARAFYAEQFVLWMDRQLRKTPRMYRWLNGPKEEQ